MQRALAPPSAADASRRGRCRRRPAASASRRPPGTSARPAPRSCPARRRARRRSGGIRSPAWRRMDCRRPPACDPREPARPRSATGAIIGFALEKNSYCSRNGCSCCIHSASGELTMRANHGLRKCAVEREIDLGNAGGGREAALIGRIVAAERANVVERPRLAAHHPVAGHEIGVGRVLGLALEHRLVEAGRQRVDQVDIARELAVLLFCHAAGDEDAEVTDGLVDRVDDRLAVGADLVDVLIEIENPSERLLGRRDVVALRAEHHDRRADVAQVDRGAVRRLDLCRRRDCCRRTAHRR